MKNPVISVLMTALNEENNVKSAISNVLQAFDDFNVDGEVILINDGSTDATQQIVEKIMLDDKRVKIIRHNKPIGVGASFWEGVDNSSGDIAVWFPADNENDPWEIFRYNELLNHVDMVIPFVFNKEVRSVYRNLLSYIYRFIINTTFLVNFNYTNGTVLYRKSILKELDHRSSGFFFQTDVLIRSVKKGYLFAEVPYRLGSRNEGISTAVSFPSLLNVTKGYMKLITDYYLRNYNKKNKQYADGSLTSARKKNQNIVRH
jgi:glycosyltransferase involved in cell wall biosynthesis